MALIGSAIGIVLSLMVFRALGTVLYGVRAFDPLTLSSVTFVLVAVAFMASYIPALRATHVDPVVALRDE